MEGTTAPQYSCTITSLAHTNNNNIIRLENRAHHTRYDILRSSKQSVVAVVECDVVLAARVIVERDR